MGVGCFMHAAKEHSGEFFPDKEKNWRIVSEARCFLLVETYHFKGGRVPGTPYFLCLKYVSWNCR